MTVNGAITWAVARNIFGIVSVTVVALLFLWRADVTNADARHQLELRISKTETLYEKYQQDIDEIKKELTRIRILLEKK